MPASNCGLLGSSSCSNLCKASNSLSGWRTGSKLERVGVQLTEISSILQEMLIGTHGRDVSNLLSSSGSCQVSETSTAPSCVRRCVGHLSARSNCEVGKATGCPSAGRGACPAD